MIDLREFQRLFFEEAREQLASLEQAILEIGDRRPDPEEVHGIFRLIHSIKGGAAAFGFQELIDPAHALETELDQVRQGQQAWSRELSDQLLKARDTLTSRLVELQSEQDGPAQGSAEASTDAQTSLRVQTAKVDAIINQVGEIAILQEMLMLAAEQELPPGQPSLLKDRLAQFRRQSHALHELVLAIRMVPVESVFSRFVRLCHDLSGQLGKRARLEILGRGTELDKGLVEQVLDPITHLIRNALDHGIETPEQRLACGKPLEGLIQISAQHRAGSVVIQVSDDGAGISIDRIRAKAQAQGIALAANASEEDLLNTIFHPGFSTAEQVTSVSGRGVGMDVVRQNIMALGGSIQVWSQPGQGSRFTLTLPLTLAMLDGIRVRVGPDHYLLPTAAILESVSMQTAQTHLIQGQGYGLRLRGEYLPIIDLRERFGLACPSPMDQAIAVVVRVGTQQAALLVDELLAQQQVVIKSLETHFRRVAGFSGATILGDGTVALILDLPVLLGHGHGLSQASAKADRQPTPSQSSALGPAQSTRLEEARQAEKWGFF